MCPAVVPRHQLSSNGQDTQQVRALEETVVPSPTYQQNSPLTLLVNSSAQGASIERQDKTSVVG